MYIILMENAGICVFFLPHHYIAVVEVTQLELIFPILRISLQMLNYVRY